MPRNNVHRHHGTKRVTNARLWAALALGALLSLMPATAMADGWTTGSSSLITNRADSGLTTAPCPGTTGLTTDQQCLYDVDGALDGNYPAITNVEYFDPSPGAQTWGAMASTHAGHSQSASITGPCPGTDGLATDPQCIYAIAGDSGIGEEGSVEYYDPQSGLSGSWVVLPKALNTPRYWDKAVTAPCPGTTGLSTDSQCLFVMGGYSNALGAYLSTVEYFDPANGLNGYWTTLPSTLNEARAGFGATTAPCPGTTGLSADPQCIYVLGGFGDNTFIGSVEYYDPTAGVTGDWVTMPNSLIVPTEMMAATTGPCPGSSGLASAPECVFDVGGYTSGSILDGVEVYDPTSGLSGGWSAATDGLDTPRGEMNATVAPCLGSAGLSSSAQCVYSVGGAGPGGTGPGLDLGSYEYYDPSTASVANDGSATSSSVAPRVRTATTTSLMTLHVRLLSKGAGISGRQLHLTLGPSGDSQACTTGQTNTNGRASCTVDTSAVPGGEQPVVATLVGSTPSTSFSTTTFAVDIRTVLVTAGSPNLVHYLAPIPNVTCGYQGFQSGQTLPATVAVGSTTYVPGDPAGTYPTTCRGASDPEYSFIYAAGALKVTRAVPVLVPHRLPAIRRGKPVTFSAALHYLPAAPITGRSVNFSLGKGRRAEVCHGLTTVHGIASCTIVKVKLATGKTSLKISFAGDSLGPRYDYAPVTKSVTAHVT